VIKSEGWGERFAEINGNAKDAALADALKGLTVMGPSPRTAWFVVPMAT
jgi:hypothetical protein